MPRGPRLTSEFLPHFQSADPILFKAMQEVGAYGLKLEKNRFRMLVSSIISQQISTSAARSIRARLDTLVGGEASSADSIAGLEKDQLRSVGLSSQKSEYLLDLAGKVQSGAVQLGRLGRKSDEEVIEELTQVRGVGRWTAQMFLIFSLGRLDVFPHDDLGVRVAIRDLYGLPALPDKKTSVAIATPWRPYSSIASWYCWRSLEVAKAKARTARIKSSKKSLGES